MHAGVLADDRVPRGLDGQDLLSAEEVTTRVEVAALVRTQALAEIVIHLEDRDLLFVINGWECTE